MSENKFEFHFHAPVGQNIAHVDHMDVHMDKDGKVQVMKADSLEIPTDNSAEQKSELIPEEELFKYIHYKITDITERNCVHKAICNIVRYPKMQQVIESLKDLMDNESILRTIKQDAMLAELRRLGLPDGSTTGFSDNNFFSAYRQHIVG